MLLAIGSGLLLLDLGFVDLFGLRLLERGLEEVPGLVDGGGPDAAHDVLDKVDELGPLARDVLVVHDLVEDAADVAVDRLAGVVDQLVEVLYPL